MSPGNSKGQMAGEIKAADNNVCISEHRSREGEAPRAMLVEGAT